MGSVKLGSLILIVTIVADAASAAFLRSHETRLNASSILKLGNDRCGCPPGEGWSSRNGRCQRGSVTDSHDNCGGGSGPDRCGCYYPQGWSSTSHRCKTGSRTDPGEKCPGSGGSNCDPHAPCPSQYKQHHQGNAACLIKRDGKVYLNVMTNYDGNGGKYDLPGGSNDKKGGESQQCVAYRETCEEAGLRVRIGQRVNSVVFECSIEPGTSPNPHTNCPWEVQYGVWLTYEEAKRKGRYAYRDNGNAWGGLWDLIKRL